VSIATRKGDGGRTLLPGGVSVPKSHPRLDACGDLDELVSQLGFARSLCADSEVRDWIKAIQQDLFQIGAIFAAGAPSAAPLRPLDPARLAALDEHVRRIEAIPEILRDWALPGELPAAAAVDVARAVCRRTERSAVRLSEAGELADPEVLRYLNRLSDVLWLFARLLELRAGVPNALRPR
jgi:cob(I)alamin adenosyltransferase